MGVTSEEKEMETYWLHVCCINTNYSPQVVPLLWHSMLKWCVLEALGEKLTRSKRNMAPFKELPRDNFLCQTRIYVGPYFDCSDTTWQYCR